MARRTRYNNSVRRNTYSNARYNYTSEAYSYAHDYDPIYTDETRRGRRKLKKKNKVVYAKAIKERPQNIWKIIFTAIVFVVPVFVMLAFNASNITRRTQLMELNNQLKEITAANTNLKTELTKNLDLTEVEQLAQAKLGMQVPQSYQTVYINVPKEGYTVQYEDSAENSKGFDIESIANFLFKD